LSVLRQAGRLRTKNWQLTAESAFEFEARLGETIKTPPEQAVGGDDYGGQGDGAGEKKIEILGIGGRGNHGADAHGRIGPAFEVEILGDDAGVPGAAGGGNHAGNKKRKDPRQNQFSPTLPAPDAENAGGFLQVGGNGDGASDHIEQNVPLRAQEQE